MLNKIKLLSLRGVIKVAIARLAIKVKAVAGPKAVAKPKTAIKVKAGPEAAIKVKAVAGLKAVAKPKTAIKVKARPKTVIKVKAVPEAAMEIILAKLFMLNKKGLKIKKAPAASVKNIRGQKSLKALAKALAACFLALLFAHSLKVFG